MFALRSLAELDARTVPWPSFKVAITSQLGPTPTATDVFELGATLKRVFKSHQRSRSQGELSRGGASWEILTCWYLNLLFWGTNTVVVRPRKNIVPRVFSDALAVRIKGVLTTKETDLLAFTVPTLPAGVAATSASIDVAVRANPLGSRLGVIQCKTNWNDNAQTPMLWNMIYSAQNLHVSNVTVGMNGFTPHSFGGFSYAFITVPTNTQKNGKEPFTPSTTSVVRVGALTGGNYWGNPSTPEVADQVAEYCGRNFPGEFAGGVQHHIANNVLSDPAVLEMFLNFEF